MKKKKSKEKARQSDRRGDENYESFFWHFIEQLFFYFMVDPHLSVQLIFAPTIIDAFGNRNLNL